MTASPTPAPPRCPEGTHLEHVEPVNDSGSSERMAWCATADGVAEGGFWLAVDAHGREALRLGRFHEGHPVGAWVELIPGDGCSVETAEVSCADSKRLAEQSYDEQGLLHGVNRLWTRTGRIVLDETFEHGVRVGRHRTWYPNGRPRRDGSFAAGEPMEEDLHLVEVPDARLLVPPPPPPREGSAGEARGHSVPVGVWQAWDEDGTVASTRSFDAKGHPEGTFCEARKCSEIKAGTGALALGYEGGEVRFSLRDGALDGVFEDRAWDRDDGRLHLAARRHYRNGKRHGSAEEWDERRRLVSKQTYRDGVLAGPSFEHVPYDAAWGTDVVVVGRYCDGKRCGRWTWTVGSRKRREETYDPSGEQTGEWQWGEDGAPAGHWTKAEMAYYERGELPPDVRRRKHAECLQQMSTGACCEADSDPPPQATICRNGPVVNGHPPR